MAPLNRPTAPSPRPHPVPLPLPEGRERRRFMGRRNLQNLDAHRGHEPDRHPSPCPSPQGGERVAAGRERGGSWKAPFRFSHALGPWTAAPHRGAVPDRGSATRSLLGSWRGGKHAQFPEFSRLLVWNCFMRTHVGGYFLGWLNKNFCSPARSSVLIKSTPASNSAAQTSGLSGVAQNRTLRPCAWAFSTICFKWCLSSSGKGSVPCHLKTLVQLSLTNGMREPGAFDSKSSIRPSTA